MQTIIVITIILLAVGYTARRIYNTFKKGGDCGCGCGCENCKSRNKNCKIE